MSLINVTIGGTAIVALALFAILAIATGSGFNQLIAGMGNLLLGLGVIALIIIVIIVFVVLFLYFKRA